MNLTEGQSSGSSQLLLLTRPEKSAPAPSSKANDIKFRNVLPNQKKSLGPLKLDSKPLFKQKMECDLKANISQANTLSRCSVCSSKTDDEVDQDDKGRRQVPQKTIFSNLSRNIDGEAGNEDEMGNESMCLLPELGDGVMQPFPQIALSSTEEFNAMLGSKKSTRSEYN